MRVELVENAAGRLVPSLLNGQPQVPFQGVGQYKPTGRKAAPPVRSCADYPASGSKVVSYVSVRHEGAKVRRHEGAPEIAGAGRSLGDATATIPASARACDSPVEALKIALRNAGARNGMRISTHHHFRNGDKVGVPLFQAAAELGLKDLIWFPSACFPCHAPLIELMEKGVIHHVEGSMNGPIGEYCSTGKMRGMGVLRSHGGRWQAVQDGEVHVDIAVLACPTCDPFGNANGVNGPSACGGLGFGLVDSMYADHVIAVTDNLVPFPCVPWQIQGNNVDQVVVLDTIGDPAQIISGTTQLTRSPDRLMIAEMAAQFVREAGIMKDGFSFQAGAGGTSLAFAIYLKQYMKEALFPPDRKSNV